MNRTLRLIFRVMAVMFVATAFGLGASAQEKGSGKALSVSGVVTDNTGAGLPGANVLVVGSKNWAITDAKGAYSVQAGQGDVLEFSFIGMLTRIVTVGTSAVINISLEDDTQMLEEAVSIGYGTQNARLSPHQSRGCPRKNSSTVLNRIHSSSSKARCPDCNCRSLPASREQARTYS